MHKEFFLIFFFFFKDISSLEYSYRGQVLIKVWGCCTYCYRPLGSLSFSLNSDLGKKKKKKFLCYFSLILSTFYFPFSFLNIPIFLSAQPNGYFVLDCENFMLVNFLKFWRKYRLCDCNRILFFFRYYWIPCRIIDGVHTNSWLHLLWSKNSVIILRAYEYLIFYPSINFYMKKRRR